MEIGPQKGQFLLATFLFKRKVVVVQLEKDITKRKSAEIKKWISAQNNAEMTRREYGLTVTEIKHEATQNKTLSLLRGRTLSRRAREQAVPRVRAEHPRLREPQSHPRLA
jgi:hypothetical protein